jgi:CubicO group peptidase (beta-lactamase class C family)
MNPFKLWNCPGSVLSFAALSAATFSAARAQSQVEAIISRIEMPQTPNRQGLESLPLKEVMAKFHVPGLSVAVIENSAVQWAKAYGVADVESGRPVDTHTLFQACSISKPVTAVGAMILVQEGRLNLDEDINRYLKSWKVTPGGPLPVTPRSLMSHTSGADDGFGFPGYPPSAELPTPVQILNGQAPSTLPPVKFVRPRYEAYKYSGGGVLTMMVAIDDVTQRPFAEFMREAVLRPIGMVDSTYEQPLPRELQGRAAMAHGSSGKRLGVPWHVYPEQAAAGLWTTPSDLAQFVLEVQAALRDGSGKVLTTSSAQQMTTPVGVGPFAVGLEVQQRGEGWYFTHSGSNWGFICDLIGHFKKGYGVVAMTNSEAGMKVITEFEARVAAAYNWDSLYKPLVR